MSVQSDCPELGPRQVRAGGTALPDTQRDAAIALWKKWYLGVRPYDERDDLGEAPAK